MQVHTVRDLGALVRTARRAHGLTQAELADRLRVSRDWVIRLEKGSPRLETQKVLDALAVLGLRLDVADVQPTRKSATQKTAARKQLRSAATGRYVTHGHAADKSAVRAGTAGKRASAGFKSSDPFAFLNDRTS
ncbi:MAG TPA: helix-turn-helix domain-containing protein [Dermatophilaceae bacterium]|nr:helix-turn-helix domain-containing protein [Dermatophilaceae bacterium]